MDSENVQIISDLKDKVNKLISLYKDSKNKIVNLEETKIKLSELLEKKEIEIKNLNEKNNKLQLAKTFMATSEDSHEAKIKINRIVREIDNCIALLNR